jgi:hypothetical protein
MDLVVWPNKPLAHLTMRPPEFKLLSGYYGLCGQACCCAELVLKQFFTHLVELPSSVPVMLHGYTTQTCAAQMGFEPETPLFQQFRIADGCLNPSLHEFKKYNKKIYHHKTDPETQQVLHYNYFIDDFPNFNENLYKYHMIHHGYCQLLHYMDMYHI